MQELATGMKPALWVPKRGDGNDKDGNKDSGSKDEP
jgi:hypothetical protein